MWVKGLADTWSTWSEDHCMRTQLLGQKQSFKEQSFPLYFLWLWIMKVHLPAPSEENCTVCTQLSQRPDCGPYYKSYLEHRTESHQFQNLFCFPPGDWQQLSIPQKILWTPQWTPLWYCMQERIMCHGQGKTATWWYNSHEESAPDPGEQGEQKGNLTCCFDIFWWLSNTFQISPKYAHNP